MGDELNGAFTENGARSNKTTGSKVLNLFARINALRGASVEEKVRLLEMTSTL